MSEDHESNKLDLSGIRNADMLERYPHVGARQARMKFRQFINTARIDGKISIVTDHGEPAVALVPISVLRILNKIKATGAKS